MSDQITEEFSCEFTDRSSRDFQARVCIDADQLVIHVLHGKYRAGHVFCTIRGDELMLGDICLENAVELRGISVRRFLCRLFRQPMPTIGFRRNGLGSEIMEFLFETASNRGIKTIVGRVPAKGVAENPKLLDWYRGMGFSVTPTHDDKTWVVEISKSLHVADL
jgi:hypothetical protein